MTLEDRAKALGEKYASYGKAADVAKILDAYDFAAEAHKDQYRQSGEPYVTHALAVAEIVADMSLDADSISAALLHDTVEDTSVTNADIVNRFGKPVAEIVDGLTKLERIPYSSKEEQEVENLRKMLLAMSKDIRVILVKLADRLHNIRTLDAKSDVKRREIALETMDVYSPIAHRLGITRIKQELEDRSLRYLDPIGYDEIVSALESTSEFREGLINRIKSTIAEGLAPLGIKNLCIEGRVKQIYSIYRKMFMQNKTIDEVYDLYAIRVIVDTKEECYNALGMIHDMYKPMPRRFKDYISTPKPNMYQSLHTTLIGREGIPFEVQIRTWEMHHIAEYGVAAHWKYKEGNDLGVNYEQKLGWIRSMLETQQDSDAEDFISNFKTDMFADEVYVFTPKGDVINLPAGATTIDFAYAIHSGVGNRMVGAKVNNRIVSIDTVLSNGDIVEVLTSKVSRGPGRDWLKIVKTSEARTKIKQWYKKEKREENIVQGREMLDAELKKNGMLLSEAEKCEAMLAACKKLSFNNIDDMLAGIGYGGITVQRAAVRIRDEFAKTAKPEQTSGDEPVETVPVIRRSESGVIVEGSDSCLVKFARCCTPVPGDRIRGFVTRGYGVSVHRAECTNITGMKGDLSDRFVEVCWADITEGAFSASIEITARDRVTLIADITALLANMHIPIHGIQTKKVGGGEIVLQMDISVNDLSHLEMVCGRVHGVRGVTDVSRSGVRRGEAEGGAEKK